MQIRYRAELPDLMRSLKLPLVAVEVGTAEGYFSADLLRLGIEKLYSVDVWQTIKNQKGDASQPQEWHDKNLDAAVKRVKEFGARSMFIKGLSVEATKIVSDNSLGLVYLDADHSYEGVMNDLNAWFPKLVKGGIMASHDYAMSEYGVRQAFEEFTKINASQVSKIYLLIENKREDSGGYFFKL